MITFNPKVKLFFPKVSQFLRKIWLKWLLTPSAAKCGIVSIAACVLSQGLRKWQFRWLQETQKSRVSRWYFPDGLLSSESGSSTNH